MKRSGMSLMEVMAAAAVLAVLVFGFAQFQIAMVHSNQKERDRAFAQLKVVQMMEELKVKVEGDPLTVLDDYNQGNTAYSFNLTIENVAGDAPLSDNPRQNLTSFRYVRQIDIKPLPRDKGARQVTIRIYRSSGSPTANRASSGAALATLANIFKTTPVAVVPTQRYNSIDWGLSGDGSTEWPSSSYVQPGCYSTYASQANSYLNSANSGLELVSTTISYADFGRDTYYAPLANTNNTTEYTNNSRKTVLNLPSYYWIGKVYFHPGYSTAISVGSAVGQGSYQRCVVNGPLIDDEGDVDYKALSNPVPHNTFYEKSSAFSVPDQYNHAMRYVEHYEKKLLQGTYTLRDHLDDLLEGKRRNPIILNTQGEVFPAIPLRNYSDAAKVPAEDDSSASSLLVTRWGLGTANVASLSSSEIRRGSHARLVTHPVKLTTPVGEDVELRVFPYKTDDLNLTSNNVPAVYKSGMVLLRAKTGNRGTTLGSFASYLSGAITVERCAKVPIFGGYAWQSVPTSNIVTYPNAPVTAANGYQAGDVVVMLDNIDYEHEPTSGFGLSSSRTLYGYHYFPDPSLPDLTVLNLGDEPRNTARFRIRFAVNAPVIVEATTTIGDDPNRLAHLEPNRSRTWTWAGGISAPDSEQYQLLGDPRHNPYEDVRAARGYNRYFADLRSDAYQCGSLAGWNSFADTGDGWGANPSSLGYSDFDVPRYLGLWREGMLRSGSMFMQPAPYGLRYVSFGAEYFATSHSKKPMGGAAVAGTFSERNDPTLIVEKANGGGSWYAKPWLGELYPDTLWDDWRDMGNLSSDDYSHVQFKLVNALPSEAKRFKRTRRVDNHGVLSLLNSDNQHFTYDPTSKLVPLTSDHGKATSADFFAMLNAAMQATVNFKFHDAGTPLPQEWMTSEAQNLRTTFEPGIASGSQAYYASADGTKAIAPFAIRRGDQAAYFLFASMPAHWTSFGGNNDPRSAFKAFVTGTMQGYFDMAKPTFASGASVPESARIRLLPRIKVSEPEDDALVTTPSLRITWDPEWKRWDTTPYSRHFTDYLVGFSVAPPMVYQIKYSPDMGKTWYLQGRSGTAALGSYYATPAPLTATSIDYNVSTFLNKQYQIRIEGFRTDPAAPGVFETDHLTYAQFSINVVK